MCAGTVTHSTSFWRTTAISAAEPAGDGLFAFSPYPDMPDARSLLKGLGRKKETRLITVPNKPPGPPSCAYFSGPEKALCDTRLILMVCLLLFEITTMACDSILGKLLSVFLFLPGDPLLGGQNVVKPIRPQPGVDGRLLSREPEEEAQKNEGVRRAIGTWRDDSGEKQLDFATEEQAGNSRASPGACS